MHAPGGLAEILVKNTLSVHQLEAIPAKSFENITVSVLVLGSPVHIVVFYRLPGSALPLCLDEFMGVVTSLSAPRSEFAMVSDFNIQYDTNAQYSQKVQHTTSIMQLKSVS